MLTKRFLLGIYIFHFFQGELITAVTVESFGLPGGSIAAENTEITLNCNVTIKEIDGLQSLNVLKDKTVIATCLLWADRYNTCSIYSHTPARYNVTYIKLSVIVTISSLQRADGGDWYCGFQTMPSNILFHLSVYWPPSTPFFATDSFPWLEGQKGRQLKCESSDYGKPEAKVVWISIVGTPASKLLNLPLLTKHHNGINVSCQLINRYTEELKRAVKSHTIQLNIQYIPDVFIYVENMEKYTVQRNEGQSLNAVCSAKGNPVPTVTWQGQATGVTKLVFTDIDRTNHGDHNCTAKAISAKYPTYDFSNETTLKVLVNYAPVVTVDFSNPDPTENSSLRITCNAVGRPNDYTYRAIIHTWERAEIISSEHKQTGGVIYIRDVQLQDSGTYTCVVNNGVLDRNHQLDQTGNRTVMIKVSPKVLLEEMNVFFGSLEKTTKITVPFYCYPEIRIVKFEFGNGSVLTNSSKHDIFYHRQIITTTFYGQLVQVEGYNAVLYIQDAQMSDFTNYTLILSNEIGSQTHWSFRHVMEGRPSVPFNFTYIGNVDGVPTFSFVRGFNGGRRQTVVVETAMVGTEYWIEQIRFNETDRRFLTDDGLTAVFNITRLAPGTYNVRLLAFNDLGRTEEGNAPALTFTVDNPLEVSQKQSSIGAIAGGTIAAFVVIATLVIVSVIVLRKRKLLTKDKRSNGKKLENLKPESRYNSNLTCEDDPHLYASVDSETTFQYETLQEAKKEKETNTYDELKDAIEITSASSAFKGGDHFSIDATHDKSNQAYENLKI